MATPVIYQGDDTDFLGATALSVNLSTDFDLDGCTVVLFFAGCRREFSGLTGQSAVLPLAFSAKETGHMPVGTHKATICVTDSAGRKRTASDDVRIRVTDDLREAYGGEDAQEIDVSVDIGIDPSRLMDGVVLKTNTPNSMRQAVKKMAQALGATVSALAVAALPVFGASVQTAPLGELDLDQNPSVVTNVDLSGLLTAQELPAYWPLYAVTNAGGTAVSKQDFDGLNLEGIGATASDAWQMATDALSGLAGLAHVGTDATNYTDAVALEFERGTRTANFASNAFTANEANFLLNDLGDQSYNATHLITESTNAARAVVREMSLGGIWDSRLGVWWTPIMENGALRYIATTNVNLSAEGN